MPVSYLPKSQNRCVYADYELMQKKTFWGYEVQVHNHAADVAPPHKIHESGSVLCAKVIDKMTGKLGVAPCFMPNGIAGPYWVIAYSDSEGYALISGGPPFFQSLAKELTALACGFSPGDSNVMRHWCRK